MFTYIEVPDFLLDIERETKAFYETCDELYETFSQNCSQIEKQFSHENLDVKLSEAEKEAKDLKKQISNSEIDKLEDEILKLDETERCLKNQVELKEKKKIKERLKAKKLYAKRNQLMKVYRKVCHIEFKPPCFYKVSLIHDDRSYVVLKSDAMDYWQIVESSIEHKKLKHLRSYIAKTENILPIIPALFGLF